MSGLRPLLLIVCMVCFCHIMAQEIQVHVDEKGEIKYIDSKLGKNLELFKQYKNFQEARLFQISDSLYVLEILYESDGMLLKERKTLSPEEVAGFRRMVTSSLVRVKQRMPIEKSGRTKLIVDAMTLSMGCYGWAVPAAFDVENVKLVMAIYMLVSGAGFYIPYSCTSKIFVSDAAATLSHYLGTRGIVHGITFAKLAFKEPSERATLTSCMLFSLSEFTSGLVVANKLSLTSGSAEVIGISGDFGLGMGLGMARLLNFTKEGSGRKSAMCVLIGSGIGYLGGKLIADQQYFTRGDAYVFRSAGLLGAFLPLALVDAFEPENDKPYIASSMIGALIGLSLGNVLVYDKDFSTAQGTYLYLSEVAGGLVGLGLAYLVSDEERDNSTFYLASSAIGAASSFWLMYRNYERGMAVSNKELPFQFCFCPETLASVFPRKSLGGFYGVIKPLLSFSYRF